MAITFVHSLWGDERATRWPGAMMNVIELSTDRRPRVCPGELHVYAWGEQNYRFLWSWGFDPILVSKDPYGDWSHKWRSILLAFESGATSVCWMDLDTVVRNTRIRDWKALAAGPVFQGRLFSYRRRQPIIRSKVVVRGGCMMLRDPSLAVDAMQLMRERNIKSDEVAMTHILAARLFGGRWKEPQHQLCRVLGIDNCLLYTTKTDSIQQSDGVASLCQERKFQRRMVTRHRGPWPMSASVPEPVVQKVLNSNDVRAGESV